MDCPDDTDAVHIAAVQGNLDILKRFWDDNVPLDKKDSFGETPIMEAIMYGHRNVAGFLIDKVSSASVAERNLKHRRNALHLMAKYGRPWRGIWNMIVQVAPECLHQEDKDGRTPFGILQQLSESSEGHKSLTKVLEDTDAVHIAAVQGNLDILKRFWDDNVPLDKKDSFGETPLMEAVMYGHRNVAGFLIDKVSSASVAERNLKHRRNALHLMAKYGRPWRGIWNMIVQIAPECLHQEDKDGRTPFEILQELSESSEGHKILTTFLEDAVRTAVAEGKLDLLKKLGNGKARLDRKDHLGETPLMDAICYGHRNVAEFIIEHVSIASIYQRDLNHNRNALHLIATYCRPWRELFDKIVQIAPNCLHHRDKEGRIPMELLQELSTSSERHKSLKTILDEDMQIRVNELVKSGDLEELRNLKSNGMPLDGRTQNKLRQTSLMLAIQHDRNDIAMFLASVLSSYFVLLRDTFGNNALHYMAVFGRPWYDLWQILSQKYPVLLHHQDVEKITPVELVITNRKKSEVHRRLYEYIIERDMPSFVWTLDEDTVTKYVCGLGEHAEETRNIKVMVIGHEMVGKTCLVKQLFSEYIDLANHLSTNIADLHLRRLLLDMLTLERIAGTSAKNIVLERLRMITNKIREKEGNTENVPSIQDVRDEGKNDAQIIECSESQETGISDTKTLSSRDDTEIEPTEPDSLGEKITDQQTEHIDVATGKEPTEPASVVEKLTEQQTELIDLVMRKEADAKYKTKAFVTMYDFGGEEVFYNTHHSLMTSDSIYLLVFNLAMCINKIDEPEGLDTIVKWLQSIATYAVDMDESRRGTPPVLTIGSHLDLVKKTENVIRENLKLVFDKLKSVPGIKEIWDTHVKGFFAIGNLNDSSKNADVFQEIWKVIREVAPLQSQWKKHIPGKWIALEFELLQKKESGVKVMTIEDLMELNKNLALPLVDIENVKLFLRYLHMTGFMLCFDLESESPIIVLNAQWVIDAFKCLITAFKFVTGLSISEKTLWEEFEKTGRLPFEVMKMLWEKHPEDNFLDHLHVLVAVMERLGLLVKPLPKDKDDEVDSYVVPSMLKRAGNPEIIAMRHILNKSAAAKSCTLCIRFQKRFIPQAIWDKFIAACIHRFQPFTVPDLKGFRHCYRGSVALTIDYFWNLMIHCRENVMKLTLFKMTNESQIVPGTGYNIRLVLADVLEQTLAMNHQGHLKFDYYLHCDPIVCHGDVAIEANKLLLESPLDCIQTTIDGQKTVAIEREQYDVWFKELPEKTDHVTGVDLHRRPTSKELGRIAKHIFDGHHMFFIELGLKDTEISQIRHTCGHLSFRSQVTKIFLSWCNRRRDAYLHQIACAMDAQGLDSHTMMEEIEHVEDDVILEDTGIPEQHLHRPPDSAKVEIIAGFIDTSYFNLYLELGLKPQSIVQYEMDYKDSGVKKLFIALLNNVWIPEFGEEATLYRILIAMQECNMAICDLTDELVLNIDFSEC